VHCLGGAALLCCGRALARLAGAGPQTREESLRSLLGSSHHIQDGISAAPGLSPARLTSGRAFVVLDRLLDQPTGGPLFLRRPEIAGVVVQALQDGQLRFQRYQLPAFVVMPNHVHLLVSPAVSNTIPSGRGWWRWPRNLLGRARRRAGARRQAESLTPLKQRSSPTGMWKLQRRSSSTNCAPAARGARKIVWNTGIDPARRQRSSLGSCSTSAAL